MRHWTIYLVLILCAFTSQNEALIVEAHTLEPFEQALQAADEHTLVLFDVDDTLIHPTDRIFHPHARDVWESFNKRILKNHNIVPADKYPERYLFSQMLLGTNFALVDPKVLSIIDSLHKRNIKTIAFTKMHSGLLGAIQSLADWRFEQLKKLDLDFSKNFSHLSDTHIHQLSIDGVSPYFKNGILYANKHQKGPVIAAFLELLEEKPTKIIFLDDRQDYLESVEKALKGSGIEFIGLQYKAVEKKPCLVDENLAEYQFLHLGLHGVWLNDEAASQHMLK